MKLKLEGMKKSVNVDNFKSAFYYAEAYDVEIDTIMEIWDIPVQYENDIVTAYSDYMCYGIECHDSEDYEVTYEFYEIPEWHQGISRIQGSEDKWEIYTIK